MYFSEDCLRRLLTIENVTTQRFLPLTSLEVILAKDCEECVETFVKTVEECILVSL